MQNKKKKNNMRFSATPSADAVDMQPADSYEMVNKYGRCEIQPTAASGNPYPAIGQGLAPEAKKNIKEERDAWLKKNNEEFADGD